MRSPIPAGLNRVLVQLHSGEYVCVDPNSYDSIDYLLGWPMEADVVPVFRRFLRPNSVVLDIGANFGLYSAITVAELGDGGRLYAFEGNPYTFDYLKRTLYANRASRNPNVVAANLLVGAAPGHGTLYYIHDALGGATMIDVRQMLADCRSVEVEMTAIDAFLPADLAVDLVKIDVEGHEPFVLQGMRETIERSRNIRILIEFYDGFLVYTVPPGQFIDQIQGLGFAICRTRAGGVLERADLDEIRSGAHQLLLTRTPDADIALVNRRPDRVPATLQRRWRRLIADWRRGRRR